MKPAGPAAIPRWTARLERSWASGGPLALALRPLALAHALLLRARRVLFAIGCLRVQRLPVPDVVVGNYIVGGVGKTPTVLALVRMLERLGHRPGIVSRGYGGHAREPFGVALDTPPAQCGDEPLLLRRRSGLPVFVGRDRVAAARALLASHPLTDIIVADDGLQHLRLGRDLQVVVFDERGVGNGWPLPAGPLREPLPAVLPDRTLVLYNASHPSTAWSGSITEARLGGITALADWWRGSAPSRAGVALLRGRRVIAACGVARPQRFFRMLLDAGLDIVPLALPDHFDYAALPWPADATDVVVTEKDAVKLDPERVRTTRVWVAALDFEPPQAFFDEVMRLLALEHPIAETPHGNSSA